MRPATGAAPSPDPPHRGRPPLSADAVRGRVTAYCQRYGVVAGDHGLPPFPAGRRETRQHREWLTIYRAVRRLESRTGVPPKASASRASAGAAPCAVCAKPLPPSAREVRLGARGVPRARLHPHCADLVERLRQAGPDAAERAGRLLWSARPL